MYLGIVAELDVPQEDATSLETDFVDRSSIIGTLLAGTPHLGLVMFQAPDVLEIHLFTVDSKRPSSNAFRGQDRLGLQNLGNVQCASSTDEQNIGSTIEPENRRTRCFRIYNTNRLARREKKWSYVREIVPSVDRTRIHRIWSSI